MAMLTKYGTLWGQVPRTGGRTFWVAPASPYTIDGRSYSSSDNNDGLSPERALATLTQAITNATANVGDVIVLLPGAHSWSAVTAVNVAGLTIMGLPYSPEPRSTRSLSSAKPKASITTSASDAVLNITVADIELVNLTIIPVTAQSGIKYSGAANNLTIRDCYFDMATPAGNASTIGLSNTGSSTSNNVGLLVTTSIMHESNTGTSQGVALALGGSRNFVVEQCTYRVDARTSPASAAWTGANSVGDGATGIFRDCDFLTTDAVAITSCLVGGTQSTNSGVGMLRCFGGSSVTKMLTSFAASNAYIAENYLAAVGVGSGSSKVTYIS